MESVNPTPEPRKNKKENFFSEWLEQLQQESWQLELLISGLALFGIFESRGLIERLEYYFDVNVTGEHNLYTNVLMMVLWSGWAIFLTNLLIHIIIRGLWIGAIGLRYVSGDIDFDTFNYSEVFIKYYKKRIGSFDNYIERLEKISSVLFSFTFLLFFMFVSFAAFNLAFIIAINIVETVFSVSDNSMSANAPLFGFAYYGIGLFVLIDFITLGAFKKVKDRGFSLVYFWIYRFYSTVSLSFIFRPLLLNFIDNKYTRRLFFLAIPYTLIILGGNGLFFEKNIFIPTFNTRSEYRNEISKLSVNWLYYDDLREAHFKTFDTGNELPKKKKIYRVSLDQYENDDNSLSLFLEFQSGDDVFIKEATGITPFRKSGIGHTLFARGNEEDAGINKIDSIYVIRSKLLNQIVKNTDDPIKDELQESYSDDITYWKKHTADELSTLRSELRSDNTAQKENYMETKLNGILTAIINMHTFTLNDQEVKPSVSYFMEHNNLHEKGVICYFPLDSIPVGNHMLKVIKSRQQKDCTEGCDTRTFYLPFRKL